MFFEDDYDYERAECIAADAVDDAIRDDLAMAFDEAIDLAAKAEEKESAYEVVFAS